MVVLWCVITFVVCIICGSALTGFIKGYLQFPQIIKNASYDKKQIMMFTFILHFAIFVAWFVVAFTVKHIGQHWIAILVTGLITMILVLFSSNTEALKKDLLDLSSNMKFMPKDEQIDLLTDEEIEDLFRDDETNNNLPEEEPDKQAKRWHNETQPFFDMKLGNENDIRQFKQGVKNLLDDELEHLHRNLAVGISLPPQIFYGKDYNTSTEIKSKADKERMTKTRKFEIVDLEKANRNKGVK